MSTTTTPTDAYARLLDLAQAALDDPTLSPAELAARAHLSRFHFDRLVTAAGGEPPGALRRRLLLERAAHRLADSPRPTVLDVAVEAGYASHEAFTRAFRRAYGVAPTALHHASPRTPRALELPGPSGVHYHPPGGLRLPATTKETTMDVLLQLVDHHVDSLSELIRLAGTVPADVLDRPISSSVEQLDDEPTLRSLLGAMVTQEEHWLSALRGGDWPDDSDTSLHGLARRHERAGADYRAVVADAAARDGFADTFVDTTSPTRSSTRRAPATSTWPRTRSGRRWGTSSPSRRCAAPRPSARCGPPGSARWRWPTRARGWTPPAVDPPGRRAPGRRTVTACGRRTSRRPSPR